MSVLQQLCRSILAARLDIETAVSLCQSQGDSPVPFWDLATLCEGLLVRVAIPKKDVERLVLNQRFITGSLGVGLQSTELISERLAALRAHFERGHILYRVGAIRTALAHTIGGKTTIFFSVDLGDVEETFQLRHVATSEEITSEGGNAVDIELQGFLELTMFSAKKLPEGDVLSRLHRKLQWIQAKGASVQYVSEPHKLTKNAIDEFDASSRSDLGDTHRASMDFAVRSQRETIQSLRQELINKDSELLELELNRRDLELAKADEMAALQSQVHQLTQQLTKIQKDQQERENKLRPLLEVVKPLNNMLKLVREKLRLPANCPLELVERTLREANVTSRS